MSIRSSDGTAFLSRTSGMVNHNAAYTVCLWVKIAVDTNQYGHFWAASDTTTDTYEDSDFIGMDADGTTLRGGAYLAAAGSVVLGANLVVGTWYHVAAVRASATDWRMYLNGTQEGATVTLDVTTRNATLGEFLHRLNGSAYFQNGNVAAYKAWNAALTADQIKSEMRAVRPMRGANLVGWTPFLSSVKANALVSRVGGNWTENGTLSVGDGPPVSWGARVHLVGAAAAAAAAVSAPPDNNRHRNMSTLLTM